MAFRYFDARFLNSTSKLWWFWVHYGRHHPYCIILDRFTFDPV